MNPRICIPLFEGYIDVRSRKLIMLKKILIITATVLIISYILFFVSISEYQNLNGFEKFAGKPIPRSTKNIEITNQFWPILGEGQMDIKFNISIDDFKKILAFRKYFIMDGNSTTNTAYTYNCKDGTSIIVLTFNNEEKWVTLNFRGYDIDSF